MTPDTGSSPLEEKSESSSGAVGDAKAGTIVAAEIDGTQHPIHELPGHHNDGMKGHKIAGYSVNEARELPVHERAQEVDGGGGIQRRREDTP